MSSRRVRAVLPTEVRSLPALRGLAWHGRAQAAVVALALLTAGAASPLRAATLTLNTAIERALANNQDLKVSSFGPQIANANVLAEYGRFDPELTFRRTYTEDQLPITTSPLVKQVTQTDDYALSLGGLTPWGLAYDLGATANNRRGSFNRFNDEFVTFGGVSVTQPLLRGFGFGANLANLRIAKADRRISEWQHRQNVIDTVTDVVLAYNTVLLAKESLRIARFSRGLTAQLVDQNEKKNRIGTMSDADVIQARAQLATREEQILFAERTLRDAENALRRLVGETTFPVNGPELELEDLPPAADVTIDAGAGLKQAYELRPDYQAARSGIDRRRASSALAQNSLLPRVDLVGSYGYTGVDADFGRSRQQMRDRDVPSYSAGIVVSVPLTFAEGRGRARAARLTLRQSEADLVRLEQDIAIVVAAAAGQVETTKLRVAATRVALDLAQQNIASEQKKLDAGTSTTFFLLQSQRELTAAQSSYARALADHRRALANYEREIGTTLESRGIKLDKSTL